jgi:hypothetical protein
MSSVTSNLREEVVMDRERFGANRRRSAHLHPIVARLGIGTIVWTLLAIWILFSRSYYGILLFGVVTFLVGMFVALPALLFRFGRDAAESDAPRLRDWLDGEFETASGPIEAREAAILILLVPMSIAVGMTAFGLLALLAARGVL